MKIFDSRLHGEIQIISFEKFISLLPVNVTKDKVFGFNTLIGHIRAADISEDSDLSSSNYKCFSVYPCGNDPVEAAMVSLSYQAGYRFAFKENLMDMLENAVLESSMEWGCPKYAVRIFPRTWILVDLEDFELIRNEHGHALLCLAQCRTKVIQVFHKTKQEALGQLKA